MYSTAYHGISTTLPGWRCYVAQHFNRRTILACAREDGSYSFGQLRRFLDGMRATPRETLVELAGGAGEHAELSEGGWRVAYGLPVHLIPTDDAWRGRLEVMPHLSLGSVRVGEVTDEETLQDFAYVQEQAYRESYDWPRGLAGLFYSDLRSCVGPDTIAAVLYVDGRPVRVAQLVRAGNVVHGVAGAAVPQVRGLHLGEPLMYFLTLAARERFGAFHVMHMTMPAAVPIAKRLGLEEVARYVRWSPS